MDGGEECVDPLIHEKRDRPGRGLVGIKYMKEQKRTEDTSAKVRPEERGWRRIGRGDRRSIREP